MTTKWSANTRRAWYLGLIEAIEARREREKDQRIQILQDRRESVLAYVRSHPGCTYQDIAKEFGLRLEQAYICAHYLRDQGAVRSSTKTARWWAEPTVTEPADVLIAAEMARPRNGLQEARL